MNRLNSIALLAGGVLVAVAATGCSSNPAKSAAAGPAAGSSSTLGAPGAPSTSTTSLPSAPGSASSSVSAPSGGASSSAAGAPSTGAPAAGGATTAASAPPVSHPACANAQLNASLAQGDGQSPAIAIIAVKNTGPTCLINPIPYVWIVKSPTDPSDELRPLVPGGTPGTAKLQTILTNTTLYAAVDVNPNSVPDTPQGYNYLEVTANPSKNTSGKDVQDVKLPMTANVSGPKLGVYTTNPSSAIDALQYSNTPES
ncbi:hypothetical protein Caci_1813 [Catenulispora acidiphila DSM 44928]|uniref:DUF4232 domain-containing protein n=1 Tax=Catenulispora acidiphila (strain DSM 44928 / JCM 14897 / NBRC 102108 / NRRL B-24433 / ID139908) TaxID=479433 RepID=C7QD24_CATAD|nr:hypothetical protein [Catenulispora acidiphila]ACU70734.1 hypothetical protein Caci_1813 [Catenulispora acidiphila DSM 44928]